MRQLELFPKQKQTGDTVQILRHKNEDLIGQTGKVISYWNFTPGCMVRLDSTDAFCLKKNLRSLG